MHALIGRKRLLLAGALGAPLLAFAVYWFSPHRLFIDAEVNERAPAGATANVASGAFRSLEHETSGRAILIRRADDRHTLRLDGLRTSNGPELHVYLSAAPAQDDWFVYDDGDFLDLGPLKGNLGASNYDLPAGVDVKRFRSAVVWCRRFEVGFGVAPLD